MNIIKAWSINSARILHKRKLVLSTYLDITRIINDLISKRRWFSWQVFVMGSKSNILFSCLVGVETAKNNNTSQSNYRWQPNYRTTLCETTSSLYNQSNKMKQLVLQLFFIKLHINPFSHISISALLVVGIKIRCIFWKISQYHLISIL